VAILAQGPLGGLFSSMPHVTIEVEGVFAHCSLYQVADVAVKLKQGLGALA